MTLTSIEAVRLKAADQPKIHREAWTADGTSSSIQLEFHPILLLPVPRVWAESVLQTETTHYTIDYDNGILTLTSTPVADTEYVIEYTATVFSDEEIEYFLTEASNSVTKAAALTLYAWAADAAKLAKKESLSGGGGMGSVSLTTDQRARELRASADAYMRQYEMYENAGVPFETITEVPWTEQVEDRVVLNHYLDNL